MIKTSGVDVHPSYQRGFDFERAKAAGHDFAFTKISEGPYRDGSVWNDPEWESFARKAVAAFPLVGFYHFLVNSHPNDHALGGRVQAELFWRRVRKLGGAEGRMLCVDFEHYSDKYPWLTPYTATCEAFVRRLKELSDGHPVVLYTTQSFWEGGGDPSGPIRLTDVLWEARYPHQEPLDRPLEYARTKINNWSTPWQGFSGQDTDVWQFTPAGLVAGRYVDVNVSKHALKDLRAMAVAALPNADEDRPPVEEVVPTRPGNALMERVKKVSAYNRRLCGLDIEYWCWDGGNLNKPRPGVGRPASVDGPAPQRPARAFCADLLSFDLRLLGLPIPKNRFGSENYDGGTRAFRLRYASQMRPLKLSECREGDVVFVDFQTRWAPEGHIAYCLGDGPHAKLAQSHLETSCAAGEPGVNAGHTLRQSHGSGYYTSRIPREAIWGSG